MIEKRKEAIALKYDKNKDEAPKIIGKGKGKIAESILEIARENNVLIQKDSSLTELLGQLNINESIPQELYEAVAEIFALVYQVDKKAAIRSSSSKE